MLNFLIRCFLLILILPSFALSKPLKKTGSLAVPRTVFVQLFEWSWKDIAQECESYLGPNGFAAVQISPPQEHISVLGHPWWERYQPISYDLNSRAGTAVEYVDMVKRCKKVGVDIYADVVLNHMAGFEQGVGYAGTPFTHYEYPNLWSFENFHHCGRNGNDDIKNFSDLYELQNCELLNLADLDTNQTAVQNRQAQYLNYLLDLGTSGFRIDAAKHIAPRDLAKIFSKLKKSAYVLQEVLRGDNAPIPMKEYIDLGDVTSTAYPFAIAQAFKNGELWRLRDLPNDSLPSESAIVFIENHDFQRMESHKNSLISWLREPELYRLAQTFMLTWPYGYPQIFSGYRFSNYDDGPPVDNQGKIKLIKKNASGRCQAPWTCEHRLPEVPALIYFRNQLDSDFNVSSWWTNGSTQFAFTRGKNGFVFINASRNEGRIQLKSTLQDGFYCVLLENQKPQNPKACNDIIKVQNGDLDIAYMPWSASVLIRSDSSPKIKPYKKSL